MDLMIRNYFERAENEVILAVSVKKISEDAEAKKLLQIEYQQTFYSATISHSYYAIFYAAKAILLAKSIKTEMPDVHKKTLAAFKEHLIDTGSLTPNY